MVPHHFHELFADQLLSTHWRTLRLAWSDALRDDIAPVLLPQRAVISEGVCEATEAHIDCLALPGQLPLADLPGVPFALQMLTDHQALRSFPLVLTEVRLGPSDGGLTAVHLVGRDAMSVMDERRRLRCFHDCSVPGVVNAVLAEWHCAGLDTHFTWRWWSGEAGRHPERSCFIQHPDESDAGFVQRLLRGAGIGWFWRPEPIRFGGDLQVARLARQELVLFDDGRRLPVGAPEGLPWHRRDASLPVDSIDLLTPQWRLVPSGVGLRSWDHEEAKLSQCRGMAGARQGDRLAQALGPVRVAAPHLGHDPDDVERLARAHDAHQRRRAQVLHGRGGVRTLAPGHQQRIDGFPAFEGLSEAQRSFTTVRVEHVAFNNLPAELHAPALAVLGSLSLPEWAGGGDDKKPPQRYVNRFEAVPIDAPLVPPPLAEHEQPRLRTLAGLVVAPDGMPFQTDELGRSRVQLLGGEPGADTTAWVRHRTPWAGAGIGLSTVLRPGTAVDVEWLGPDRPVIAGCHFHRWRGEPPRVGHQAGLPHNGAQTALVGRELGSQRQQHLLLDDHPTQPMAQLASDAGHSVLSLGALTTPRREGVAERRGQGFELRSDDAGALRAAKGLLISTHARPQSRGHQLDAQELQARLDAGLSQASALGTLAQEHQGGDTDTEPQRRLRDHVAAWSGGPGGTAQAPGGEQAVLALAGEAGIAAATPASATLEAGENIDVVAAQNVQISTGQRFVVRAAESVSLFAHRLGLRLVAALGTLKLLALKGSVEVGAGQNLHLYASGGQLVAEAAGGLVLRTRGVEMVLKDGSLTINGQVFNVNAASFDFRPPVAVAAPDNPLAAAEAPYDQRILLVDMNTDLPAAERRYRITVEDGQVIEGVTDAEGHTQPLQTALSFARFTVELLD